MLEVALVGIVIACFSIAVVILFLFATVLGGM